MYPCNYNDKCTKSCPRYMDDCDGIDEDLEAPNVI
jgi:hypothetical protein